MNCEQVIATGVILGLSGYCIAGSVILFTDWFWPRFRGWQDRREEERRKSMAWARIRREQARNRKLREEAGK